MGISEACIRDERAGSPQPPRTVPLDDVERFVETERVGIIAGLRPATAALWMRDGSRVPIRSVRDCSGAHGVDALNARLAQVRDAA